MKFVNIFFREQFLLYGSLINTLFSSWLSAHIDVIFVLLAMYIINNPVCFCN